MTEMVRSLPSPGPAQAPGQGITSAPDGTPVLGASARASRQAPESATANQALLDAFSEMGAPNKTTRGPWVAGPVAFREAPVTKLQVDPTRLLKAAALAAAMVLPAAAGAPRSYPSPEARALAKLQIHDRTMEASRQQMNATDARRDAARRLRDGDDPQLPEVSAQNPSPAQDTLRGAVALAAAISVTVSLSIALKSRALRRAEEDSHA